MSKYRLYWLITIARFRVDSLIYLGCYPAAEAVRSRDYWSRSRNWNSDVTWHGFISRTMFGNPSWVLKIVIRAHLSVLLLVSESITLPKQAGFSIKGGKANVFVSFLNSSKIRRHFVGLITGIHNLQDTQLYKIQVWLFEKILLS